MPETEGGATIICILQRGSHRHRRRRLCAACGFRVSSLLCDYPRADRRGTCDKPLCRTCAVQIAPEVDYCPGHPRQGVLPVISGEDGNGSAPR